jgi:streptogramin lyase
VGAQPYTFTASPVDASGAIIFGPGAPSVTLTSASADVTSTAVTGQLNKFTVQVKTQSATPIVLTAQSQGATALSVPITTAPEYFVADSGSDVIRAFAITSATAAAIPSDNIAISTNVNAIGGIALDPNGKLWVSDNYHQTVSQYTIGSATPITQFSSADNWQIAFDPGGNLWVGIYNGSYGYVEKVNSSGNVLLSNYLAYTNGYTLVAVSSGQDCSANNYGLICANNINGAGLFSNGVTGGIQALAFDPSGSIWYASSYGTGGAYSFNPISGVSTGTSIGFAGFVTTVGSIKFDIAGELLVLDSFNARISVWTPTNGRLYYISLPGCSNNVTDMAIVP